MVSTSTPNIDTPYKEENDTIVHRGKYARLEDFDIKFFRDILSDDGILIDETEIALSNVDYVNKFRGHSSLVLKPQTTEEVSKVLCYCNYRQLAVVPQGGRTGVVGASVPVYDEIILSLERMNRIRSFDSVSGVFVADAGVLLDTADRWLNQHGFIFPLDLALKGECQLGGNISTNAGGLRVLRYGSLHGSVLGVEAVLANGDIFNGLSSQRKDNTGYDLKQLFIGSEGTLGVITGISILAAPKSESVHVAFFGLNDFQHVEEAFIRSRKLVAEILSAFECIDDASMSLAKYTFNLKRDPLPSLLDDIYPFHVLLETSGSNKKHDHEKLLKLVQSLKEDGLVKEALIADDANAISNIWRWREEVPKLCNFWGGLNAYDLSLPLPKMWELVREAKSKIVERDLLSTTDETKPVVDVIGYGHIGDGNIHLNVVLRRYEKSVETALEPFVYQFVAANGGSIAAEHGIGLLKLHALKDTKDPTSIKMMQAIKVLYDPNWILNPYKVIEAPKSQSCW